MEKNLRDLCEANGLTTISVMFQSRYNSFTVYPHWTFDGEDYCASGSSETIEAAISAALAEAKIKREDQAL